MIVLINGGATHNFIDEGFVVKKKLKTNSFVGFNVAIGSGNVLPCKRVVPQLKVELDNYTAVNDFYVFPMGSVPHMVLGVQWLYSLGDYITNYQILEINFKSNGCKIVLRGMKEDEIQKVTAKRTEKISEYLVQWKGFPEAAWSLLEDKQFERGGFVMSPF